MSETSVSNDESSESSSALNSIAPDFRSALDEFRENWHRELNATDQTVEKDQPEVRESQKSIAISEDSARPSNEDQSQSSAESMFRKAVELEQRGKVYDALPYYRKAIQLDPNIEYKNYEREKQSNQIETGVKQQQPSAIKDNKDEIPLFEKCKDLYQKFRIDLCDEMYEGKLILNNSDPGVVSTEWHISYLPPEILMYIMRWTVSCHLDMRSLEQCAAVCKGMYLCARDEELWRLACAKVWNHNLGSLDSKNQQSDGVQSYHTWRDMFILRERVLFNGCYISKTTYLRMGENSFQDQYYRPVQLVEYYRYVRFLPDGKALMMTNADEPVIGVNKLKQINTLRTDVLRGRYRLFGNTVTLILQRPQANQQNFIRRRGSVVDLSEEANSVQYIITFCIQHTPKRRFAQLAWVRYSIVQKRSKVETTTEFDIVPAKYPPLWFSPVRSYHLDADAPLS